MTIANSPSWWTGLASAGNWIGTLGPMIAVFGLRKITGSSGSYRAHLRGVGLRGSCQNADHLAGEDGREQRGRRPAAAPAR